MKGKASKGKKLAKVEENKNLSDNENNVGIEDHAEEDNEQDEVTEDAGKKGKRARNTEKSDSGTAAKRRKAASTKNHSENEDNNDEHSSEENNVENDTDDQENEAKGKKTGKEAKSKKTVEKKSTKTEDDESKDDDEESEEYEVEKIVDDRKVKGKRQFKIHWKGYPASSDTWEAEADLNCPAIINAYLESKSEKDKKPEKKEKKSKRGKNKTADEDSEEEVSKEEYEVESIQDVKFMKSGKREFLVRWKGYKKADDTWEPEEHLNCSDLIEKYMEKVEKAKSSNQPALRVSPKATNRLTLTEKGRRASKRNPQKERVTYFDQDD